MVRRCPGEIGAVDTDASAARSQKTRDRGDRRGLAGAVAPGLDGRHARGRLVEKKDAAALRERDGELELPAFSVRKRADRDVFATGETDALEHGVRLGVLRTRGRTKNAVGPATRGHRKG